MRARGQSVAEAALGIFVFVTVLIFGIHLAEVGQVWLKVQEATNAAMWDATSQPMHDTFAHDWNLYTNAIRFAQTQTQNRYEDFDALKAGRTTLTQVFTRANNLSVQCRPLAAVDGVLPLGPDPKAAPAYPDGQQGMVCRGQADVVGFRIPRSFLDGSLAGATHFTPVTIPMCGVGHPVAGRCVGALGMLLDDWGYSGEREAQQCPLAWEGGTTCDNQGYYDQAQAVYQAMPIARAGAASQLAVVVAGTSPINEGAFFMSFRGRESPYGPFTETVQHSHGDVLWETTPFANPYGERYDAPRSNCWLGEVCQ
jgi:hypothetical protein